MRVTNVLSAVMLSLLIWGAGFVVAQQICRLASGTDVLSRCCTSYPKTVSHLFI